MEKNYQNVLVKENIEANVSFMQCVADVFSAVMEETVTAQQAKYIINLILALFMVAFPVNIPFIVRLIFLVWFVASYFICKKTGMFDSEEE